MAVPAKCGIIQHFGWLKGDCATLLVVLKEELRLCSLL